MDVCAFTMDWAVGYSRWRSNVQFIPLHCSRAFVAGSALRIPGVSASDHGLDLCNGARVSTGGAGTATTRSTVGPETCHDTVASEGCGSHLESTVPP